jgi:hypothetical protein
MESLLINQPGRFGDILICLPIAKWYSQKFEISWFCPQQYHNLFRNISYCKPVSEIKQQYNKTIDLSFGLNTNTALHKWWMTKQNTFQSFIIAKYIIASVPLLYRWKLEWKRNIEKEELLFNKVISKYGKDYVVVQEKTHDFAMKIDVKNKVLFEPIEDYNIFDWYKVLILAKEIHCIDSCLANFVEVLPEALTTSKYYYPTSKVPNLWDKTILINNWVIK